MIKSQTATRFDFTNPCEISLYGGSLTVTDSNSKDSVTIDGLDRLQLLREIRWMLLYRAQSHDETAAQIEVTADIVRDIVTAAKDLLQKLEPEQVQDEA